MRLKTSPTARMPGRADLTEDGRQTIALLCRNAHTVNVVLVALTASVEIGVCADGALGRRYRFQRDTEAKHGDRLAGRLFPPGFTRDAAAR